MKKFNKKNISKLISEIKNKSLIILDLPEATHGIKRSTRNFLKEIFLFENYLNAQKKIIKAKNLYVQIGGGNHYLKGFLNIDILSPADIIWDVREGIPLKSNSVKFLFLEHFLEHIDYPIAVKKFISECYRVLKFRGKLVIGVPDGEFMIKKYIKKDSEFFKKAITKWYSKRDCLQHINTYIDLLNLNFRDQEDSGKYNPHLWVYDYEKLISLLKEGGFQKVSRWRFDKKIANSKRRYGSIYVIATKIKN